jgi:hypothetical protein
MILLLREIRPKISTMLSNTEQTWYSNVPCDIIELHEVYQNHTKYTDISNNSILKWLYFEQWWKLKKKQCPVCFTLLSKKMSLTQVLGERWSPIFKEWGCNNLLAGKVVYDEYGAMTGSENWSSSEKNLLQCHCIHHKSHMKSPRTESEALQREDNTCHLRYGMAYFVQGDSNMTGTDLCVISIINVPVIFEPPCTYIWENG